MPLKATHRWLPGLLVSAAVMLAGCRQDAPPQQSDLPTNPKAQIRQHLVKKSGRKEFVPGMDLGLHKQVATLRSNATALEQRTASVRAALRLTTQPDQAPIERELQELERAWETARIEAARKSEELSNQEDAYIRSVRAQMSGVRNYETLYRLVGEQLATADRLLAEPEVSRRRIGLRMAREACGHVSSGSVDPWLAARICEAYLWPNLDVADAEPGSRERTLDLLETCRRVFFDTLETNNVLKNYALLMTNAPNPRAADTFRVQLADWLEEKGSVTHAAEILAEIRDPEVLASARERITRVTASVATAR